MKRNFKKVMSFLLLTSLLLTLIACGGGGKDDQSSGGDTGESKEYKVAMITNAPIADGGWNTSAYNAMVAAAEAEGFETTYTENVAQTDYVTTIREYANLGYNLVFAPGNEFTDAVHEVAKDFPDTKFAILNGDTHGDNIASLLPNNKEIGFIAGALAGLQTETNSVGFVGGMEITPTVTMMEYYEKGAKFVNPDVQVSTAMANSYDDTAKGKEIAASMVSTNNVDVFYGHASAIDAGVREGIRDMENRWSIAQPDDFLDDDPKVILTSIVTSNTEMLKIAMQEVKNNEYGNKIIEGSLENSVVTIGRFGESAKEEAKTKFNEIVENIKAGTFDIDNPQ
ncbi:MAG: BMP family protein [Gallicola sp.]|nr:BMP family protein [Gallicola sp.]